MKADVRKSAAAGGFRAKCRYQCRLCAYSNTFLTFIQMHVMSRHLNYKPYACMFCSFRAVRPNYVRMHIHHKHRNVLEADPVCHFNPDNALETEVGRLYYSVSVDRYRYAEKDLPRQQDHTYNCDSLSATDRETASNVCHDSDGIQSLDTNTATRGPLRITLIPKKNKPHSVSSKWKFYRCKYCTFMASNRKYLKVHVSKKHPVLERKCFYCDVAKHEQSDMFIHWYTNHQDLPFHYQKVFVNGSVVDINPAAATVEMMVRKYLLTLSEFDDSQSTLPRTEVPPNEAVMAGVAGENTPYTADTADENRPSVVDDDDIIYCCETCPSSFSTAEALSLHKCASGTPLAQGQL